MALPRGHYVKDGQVAVYHCTTRCVRRAFLCGFDSRSRRDFSHRRQWLEDRLRFLASLFAVDVCSFGIMDDHHHETLRTRPDIADSWSDDEVARRWITLFPHGGGRKKDQAADLRIRTILSSPDRVATLRARLSSLSWFMRCLNEFIARAANKEDGVKGRFWESRFKCTVLLDQPSILTAMAYVDLNPVRARIAPTPESSDFTSIQLRILSWCLHDPSSPTTADPPDAWLCPIGPLPHNRGILDMSLLEYFDFVDHSGRIFRADKPGAIDPRLEPILVRLGIRSSAWPDTMSRFNSIFGLAAGTPSSLRTFADQIGSRWVKGSAAAKTAFLS